MKIFGALMVLVTCSSMALAVHPDWDPASRLEGSEKEAWRVFFSGVTSLEDKGERDHAAKLFRKVAEKYPQSQYAQDSKELAGLLDEMVKEDAEWKEPKAIEQLNLEDQIRYWIYHLRDVNCYQISQPGMCYLLQESGQRKGGANAAIKLKEIGEPAIPMLIDLLVDRRPTRSIGYWRDFSPSRTVLRYQDAAIQILNELTPTPFYRAGSTYSYFSKEKPEVQTNIIASIKTWYVKSRGKSETKQKWMAIEQNPGIYQVLSLLGKLAEKPGQKEQVLQKLRRMCNERDRIQLPQISFLMCQLGDYSELAKVADAYLVGLYEVETKLPDDSAPGANAQDYALRQMILYGDERCRASLRELFYLKEDPLSKKQALFRMLLELTSGEYQGLPKGYEKGRFPIHLLIDVLDFREYWGQVRDGASWRTIRYCDAAAEAIQGFTGVNFGYDEKTSSATKDVVIERIRSWWRDQPMKRGATKGDTAEQSVAPPPPK